MTTDADARTRRVTTTLGALAAALTVAAVVLTWLVVTTLRDEDSGTEPAATGDQVALTVAPYGREHTVLLPGYEVSVLVAAPVDRLERGLVDGDAGVTAPEGGSLVPVSWSIRTLGGFASDGDEHPIDLRLVADGERIDVHSVTIGDSGDVSDAFRPVAEAVSLGRSVALDDRELEVEYDGLTQTLDVASGEIDAGVAQALYDEAPDVTAGCTDVVDQCPVRALDADSPWRPQSSIFTATWVSLYPYDVELGWAEEGSSWAAVRLHLLGVDVRNAAGAAPSVERVTAPRVTLDGAEPVRRDGLGAGDYDSYGTVVFEVGADTVPRELALEQVATLERPASPPTVRVGATVPLTSVR